MKKNLKTQKMDLFTILINNYLKIFHYNDKIWKI